MKILEFGHIPYWAGGKQSSGGANAMFQIAYHLSKKDDVEVYFGATDVFEEKRKCGKLIIYGWTKWTLIKFCIFNITSALRSLKYSMHLKKTVPDPASFSKQFFKCLFHVYLVEKIKPDVIHLHNNPEFYVDLLYKYAKIVVTVHGVFGNDENVEYHDICRIHEQMLVSNPSIALTTFVTSDVLKNCIELYGPIQSKSVVILNAYDSSSFYYKPKNNTNVPSICTIASVCERKGQERVLKGIIISGVKCNYLCVGSGTEKGIECIKKLANDNNVDFKYLGKKTPDEIREILVQCDYMILPSSSEGFGLVYLEAMACGTPVILPKDLPIVKEDGIISTSNAVLLEDCSEQSIAKALPLAFNMKFDRKAVAESMADYSWDKITDQYLSEMRKLTS